MAHDSLGTKNQPQYSAAGVPADAADLSEVANYSAKVGNRKIGVASTRAGLTGNDVWPGLEFYETDTDNTYRYRTSGWYRMGGGTFHGSRTGQEIGSGTVSTIGTLSRDASNSDNDDFVSLIDSTGIHLIEGDYSIEHQYYVGAAVTARSYAGWSSGVFTARGPIEAGEDTGTASGFLHVASSGAKVTFQAYQQTGGVQDGTINTVTITKVA